MTMNSLQPDRSTTSHLNIKLPLMVANKKNIGTIRGGKGQESKAAVNASITIGEMSNEEGIKPKIKSKI